MNDGLGWQGARKRQQRHLPDRFRKTLFWGSAKPLSHLSVTQIILYFRGRSGAK